MIRDASVYVRQSFRDYGLTVAGVRQVAKMILRAASGAVPGTPVRGIRRWPSYDFSMGVPFDFVKKGVPPPDFRIVAVCHLFYPEISCELRVALANVPGHLDMILSTDTENKREQISRAFAGWDKGRVEIRIVANRGRDIAPKLDAYPDIRDGYEIVLFLHSKRTIRTDDNGSMWDQGAEWRHYLLHNLVGSTEVVISILEAFRRDPQLGLVMPQHWDGVRDYVDWHDVFFIARDLASRMGLRLTAAHVIDFPSGSMFWARPAALRPMLDLGLRNEDFPDEAGQIGGTLAHALERLFLFSCEVAGYRWIKVCDVSTTGYPQTVVPIETPAAIDGYRRRHGFRLTALGPP